MASIFLDAIFGQQIVFLLLAVLIVAYHTTLITLMFKRRYMQPIRARPFITVIGLMVSSGVFALEICLRWVFFHGHPCAVYLAVAWPACIVAVNCYAIRFVNIWGFFRLIMFSIDIGIPIEEDAPLIKTIGRRKWAVQRCNMDQWENESRIRLRQVAHGICRGDEVTNSDLKTKCSIPQLIEQAHKIGALRYHGCTLTL